MEEMSWLESVGAWWVAEGWPWLSEWLKSTGFAGAAAVLAALLAFSGSRHQARLNAWWQRVEWALNLYTDPASTESQRIAGLAALGAAQQSRLAHRDEQNFVVRVIDATTLDPLGDGIDVDDLEQPDDSTKSGTQPAGLSVNVMDLYRKLRHTLSIKERRRYDKG